MMKLKLIFKLYRLLPSALLKNRKISAILQQQAEKELAKVKQELIKQRWQQVKLEQELKSQKEKHR